MQNDNKEVHEAALDYIAKGFSIIPVAKNKKPLLSTWAEFQSRIATADEVEAWCKKYGASMQIGIVTGKVSGITVIDVEADGYWGDLPDTVRSKTGGGGRHFFYGYSGGLTNSVTPWPLADIRDDRAFVVVPPSENESGGYSWVEPMDRSKLAEFPMQIYREKFDRWRGLCKAYKGVSEGHRHESMVSRVGTLLRRIPKQFWETEVWVQFQEDNRNNNPALDDAELRKIFEDICEKETERQGKQPAVSAASKNSDPIAIHTCAEMLATPHVPDSFVIKPLLPKGMVSALTSQAGAGKSILALEMARCVASGEPFLGKFEISEAMPVLLLDQEMSLNTIVGRFHSLITDSSLPIYTSFETTLKITDPADYQKILDVISQRGIGLVIFDTLVTFHGGDENQVAEMREVMEAMLQLCIKTKVTVLLLHHQRKGAYGEQASQASMRGSTEIAAKIGSQMTLESREKEIDDATGETTTTLTLEQHKSRLPSGFKKFYIKSVYNENTGKSQITYTGDCEGKKSKKDVQKDRIKEAIFQHSSDKMTRQEIIEKVGAQKNTDMAIAEMVKNGELLEEKQAGSKARLYSVPVLTQPEIDF